MSENTNAGGRARLTLDLSNKLNEEVDRLAAANGVTKDDVLRFARELLAKKADAALSAQSTGSGGVAAEPVAWAYEEHRTYTFDTWEHVLSYDKPELTSYHRNIRPLYEHPPVAAAPTPPAGGGETITCAARKGNTGAGDPQECDWPVCGCDAHADKVIASLQESGLLREPSPVSPTGDLNSLSAVATPGEWHFRCAKPGHAWIADAPEGQSHSKIIVGKQALYGGDADYAFVAAVVSAYRSGRLVEAVPAAPRKGPSEEEIARLADDLRKTADEWPFSLTGGNNRIVQMLVRAADALLTPADRGETQAVGDGWSTNMEVGKREPEVDLFLSGEGIRPHRRPLHYWDQEQRGGGAWTECADRNVTDPRDRIAIPSRWVTHWRKPPAPPTSSPDQNRGEPDQGGANTEAGR